MGPGRGLRMVLDRENRVLPVPHPFDGPIVEVKVRDLKRLRTGNAARIAVHGESMILRRDKYLSRIEIAHWVVPPAMAIRELHRLAAQRQTEELMSETDPENRQRAVGQLADRRDRIVDGGGIAGAVRKEDAIGFELAYARRRRFRRHDGHAAAVLREQSQDVALHPEVE